MSQQPLSRRTENWRAIQAEDNTLLYLQNRLLLLFAFAAVDGDMLTNLTVLIAEFDCADSCWNAAHQNLIGISKKLMFG